MKLWLHLMVNRLKSKFLVQVLLFKSTSVPSDLPPHWLFKHSMYHIFSLLVYWFIQKTNLFSYDFIIIVNFFLVIMQTGTVKFFNESKGFGFILDDNSGQEIFVHVTALGGTHIRENDKVSFDIVEGKRGLNAENVSKL